jgi:hypothetical protein
MADSNNNSFKCKEVCDWKINSPKYQDCIWSYIRARSAADGSMREHSQAEISKMLGIPSTKVALAIKEATKAFKKALKKADLAQVLNKDVSYNINLGTTSLEVTPTFDKPSNSIK